MIERLGSGRLPCLWRGLVPESGHAILLFWITRVARKERLLQMQSFGSGRGLEASSAAAKDLAVCEWCFRHCIVVDEMTAGGRVAVRHT